MIPAPQLFDRDAEAIGDRHKRVAATDGGAPRGWAGRGYRDRNNELVSGVDGLARSNAVGLGDIAGTRMQRRRNAIERLTLAHYVEAPAGALLFGDALGTLREDFAGTDGDVQVEGRVARRAHSQKAWVQRDNLLQRGVGDVGYQAKVDGIVDSDRVGDDCGFGHHLIEPVLLRVLCHDDRRDDAGNVVLRLCWEDVAPVELPEVGVTGSHDGALYVARAPVVRGHRKVPFAELAVE